MKLAKLLALFLAPILLTACAASKPDDHMQQALDLRTDLMEAGGCAFTAQVTADYGQRVYTFTLDCQYAPEEGASLSVTAPEAIAGIAATVSKDGAKVTFDGADLDFGQLANGYIAPMALPWLLGDCWTSAYIDSAGADGDFTRFTYLHGYNDAQLVLDTWLDADGIPVRSEVAWDGKRCLTVELSDFSLNRGAA